MRTKAWIDYADCRLETGHHWRTLKDLGVIGANWTKLQRCSGCGTTRQRGWNVWNGALKSHVYGYPPGYLQVGKKLSLAQQRVAYSRKVLKQAAEPKRRKEKRWSAARAAARAKAS